MPWPAKSSGKTGVEDRGGRAALGHELVDCLWSVVILAHRYEVDLAAAFRRTMRELHVSVSAQLDRQRLTEA
ncbi:hypothetical protein OG226_22485 [Streptomyces sp. NBC_01261]|uniref:hypothetical protein n=1 Tax=Streptomyces sp. NBC_01261 TaxID=2903802 RepID=UPI002E31CD84|nr:hypothetical protein [Streptomyces sp. NBC_01261]